MGEEVEGKQYASHSVRLRRLRCPRWRSCGWTQTAAFREPTENGSRYLIRDSGRRSSFSLCHPAWWLAHPLANSDPVWKFCPQESEIWQTNRETSVSRATVTKISG